MVDTIAAGIDTELAEAGRTARRGYLLAPHRPDQDQLVTLLSK